MKIEDLRIGDRIEVTSPLGNKACGKIVAHYGRMAVFRACNLPISDYIREDNIHLVARVDGCC